MYYYISLMVIGLIFIWRIVVGFRKGMVQEIISLIAMAVAGACIFLIMGAVGNYLNHEIGSMIQVIVVLFVVCLVYRLVHTLFVSLELISKLPLVRGVDKLLGAAVGGAEAALIVGMLVYLLKNWGLSFLGSGA